MYLLKNYSPFGESVSHLCDIVIVCLMVEWLFQKRESAYLYIRWVKKKMEYHFLTLIIRFQIEKKIEQKT